MKRKFLYLLLTLCLLGQCLPAFAAQAPVLERIAFSGATIVGQFKSDVYQYQLVLDNAAVSPKLKSYKVQGEGNLFVTYDTDSTNHQTAVVVTLSYDTGSAKYTFTYKNAAAYVKNSENHLDSITCTLGELVPEMNADDTTYKLYIPGDLTSLMITPVTQDINAYCAPVEMTLAPLFLVEVRVVLAVQLFQILYFLDVAVAHVGGEVEVECGNGLSAVHLVLGCFQ